MLIIDVFKRKDSTLQLRFFSEGCCEKEGRQLRGTFRSGRLYIDDITYADVVTREFQSDGYAILPPIDISGYTAFEMMPI